MSGKAKPYLDAHASVMRRWVEAAPRPNEEKPSWTSPERQSLSAAGGGAAYPFFLKNSANKPARYRERFST
jgi:hypothetical protein